jgi:hypothetical protein
MRGVREIQRYSADRDRAGRSVGHSPGHPGPKVVQVVSYRSCDVLCICHGFPLQDEPAKLDPFGRA